ncbi:MAG: 16S rRNA (cytosine(1402)-N(4))-methyltransferase RsmH [Rhodothermales bacterium]
MAHETPPGRDADYASEYHAPVLCNTVIDHLITDVEGTYVDGTLGGGGHAEALLHALGANARVVGVDRDPEALHEAGVRLKTEMDRGRFIPVHGAFSDLKALLGGLGLDRVDGILLDLGVSSHQLDEGRRGFSHRFDGPLDMRMDPTTGMSAAEWLNEADEREIAMALFKLGEEPMARRLAAAIVRERPLETTAELADIVRKVVPGHKVGKALARVFQGIRIFVNDELGELERVLDAATDRTRTNGRMAVISYHSLEDRRVKRYLRSGHLDGEVRRDLYGNRLTPWRELTRGALVADAEEIDRNPRARSARLRVAERTEFEADPDSGRTEDRT